MAEEEKNEKTEVEVPEKFKALVESIEKLSVLELSELVHILEDKFGVSATAPVAIAAAPGAGGDGAGDDGGEAKTSFDVVLTAIGDQKIEVIKVVRDATGKGLKEAKDMVDAAASAPQAIKEGAGKEDADALKQKLETAGATVELK